MQAPAYIAALQLACALLAGDAAALGTLTGACGNSPEAAAGAACEACLGAAGAGTAGEAVVRAAAEVAAANASSWRVLPALWQALSLSQAPAPAQLLLAATACLQPAPGSSSAAHAQHGAQQAAAAAAAGHAAAPAAGGGGFTLSGFESSIASRVAAAKQLVAGWQLGGYYLESGG